MVESPQASEGQEKGRRLDRSLATGIAWTAAAKWTAQILSWSSTLVVAHLLTPADYGIMGMALVYLGVVQVVSEFGLTTALIQRRQLDETLVSRINGFSLIIGCALFAISIAAAPILAAFFHEPAVRGVVMTLASTFIISSLYVVPKALLGRDLQFKKLAIIESSEAITQTVVTFVLALRGAGYWSLVFGSIAGKTINTALSISARGHRMAWPGRFKELRDVLTFGWQVVVANLSWYGYSNADFVVIGRVLGKATLGAYTIGWTVASLPVDKITGILARVIVPVFAAVQNDPPELQRYLVRLSEALVVVVLPMSIGMALVSYDFVYVILGNKYADAALPLQLLSIYVAVRCVNALFAQVLLAIGDSRQSMKLSLRLVIVMPILFVIGAKLWGAPGVALMWLVGFPIVSFPPLILYTARKIGLPLSRLADALGPPLLGTCVMALAVISVRTLMANSSFPVARLAIAVACGALTYPAVMWIVYRQRMLSLINTLKHLKR